MVFWVVDGGELALELEEGGGVGRRTSFRKGSFSVLLCERARGGRGWEVGLECDGESGVLVAYVASPCCALSPVLVRARDLHSLLLSHNLSPLPIRPLLIIPLHSVTQRFIGADQVAHSWRLFALLQGIVRRG